ncbi:MAG: sigma-70 family RNA polymerase sigma factor [Gemmatimonadaceae bacterium]|nr:sigma-70 family RNA polymerase sigma factor [Gemmatimonadaceae bacterium]
MASSALTLVTSSATPASAQRGRVARKSMRGVAGSATDAKAAADALAASREAERQYVLAAQGGDTNAFAQLVRRHQQRAYAVARAVLLSHEDAEDAVQEGFLHAHRALSRFRPDQPFGAWLHRIISNAALDLARRRKVRDTDELVDTHASPFRDPAEADELHDRLRSALSQLPDRQRSVLVLHDVEGYKHAEIGAMLGIPEGTARSDLHHARAAMRSILGTLRRPA